MRHITRDASRAAITLRGVTEKGTRFVYRISERPVENVRLREKFYKSKRGQFVALTLTCDVPVKFARSRKARA